MSVRQRTDRQAHRRLEALMDTDTTRPATATGTQPPTLARQKEDFTAEGAPPPGQVSKMPPATPSAAAPAARRRRKARRSP